LPGHADTRHQGAFDRFVVVEDGADYVLGRPDLGIYVSVPEPGAVFVRAMRGGASVDEAAALAGEAAGQDVDGAEFVAGLDAAGLLAAPVDDPTATPAGGRRIRWIERVDQRTAARLFGRVAWTCYGAAAVFVIGAYLLRPELRPNFEQVWFVPDPVLSVLFYLPIGLLLAGAHEAWHWLAGRALGVPAVFRLSYRGGITLVFETDLSQIVTVPRARRYGPFLAGMAFDVSVLAVAVGLRLAHQTGVLVLHPTLDRLLAAVALAQLLQIVWQWCAVMFRSDGYAIAATALGCRNLYRATWLTTKDRVWRLTADEVDELAACGPRDREVASWFGLIYLSGLVTLWWSFLTFGLPVLVGLIQWVVVNLGSMSPTSIAFWESAAVSAYLLFGVVMPPVLAVRERRLRRRGVLL